MKQGYQAAFGLLIFAAALAGSSILDAPIGIHADCIDDVDNDGDAGDPFGNPDGGIDINGVPQDPINPNPLAAMMDRNCVEYPWADGNGEGFTPPEERFNAMQGYQSTTFELFMEWITQHDQSDIQAGELPRSSYVCNMDPAWFPPEDGSVQQFLEFCNPP